MVEALKEFFTKYATFKGRTSRGNFWFTVLGIFLINIAIVILTGILGGILGEGAAKVVAFIPFIWYLAIIIPCLAMEVRRFHDLNKSGWFVLLALIPFVGSLIVLVFMCLPAVNEGNNY